MIAHGISWTTFGVLYGSLAAAVVAIFLLRLARSGRAVSSTLIWRKVMGVVNSFWQELLSLLVQLALLLLVCLALVDPRPPADAVNRRWIAVLFDTSESMSARDGDASRLRHAERQAWQMIGSLSPVDRVMIVAAGSAVEALTPFTPNREELKKALADLRSGGGKSKWGDAIAYALAAFDYAGVGEKDEKWLIALTDRPDQIAWPEAPGVEKHTVAVGAPAANLAITAFAVRQTINLSSAYEALVEVQNFSEQPVHSELALFTPLQTLGVQALALKPGEHFSKTIGLPFGAAGKLTAVLRNTRFDDGAADALPSDDVAFAFLPPQHKVRVLLVSAKNVFLYNALALDPEIELLSIKPGDYTPATAASVDVAIFDKFTPPQPPACNAVYFAAKAGGPFAIKAAKQKPATTSWADGHPLLQHVAMQSLTILEANILAPRADDVTLMGHYDGALLLLRKDGDRLSLGFGFDLANTDLPVQAAFPILMHNIVHIFAARPEGEITTGYKIGEKVDLAATAGRQQLVLQDPLDQKIVVPVRAGLASFRPMTPGFYSYADAGATRVFAASLADPEESNLQTAPGESMPAFAKKSAEAATETYWPYFILAALALAFVDLALFFYGRLA